MALRKTYGLLLSGLLLLSFYPYTLHAQGPFVPPPLFEELLVGSPQPFRFGAADWGDFDGDGDFDLILSGSLRAFDRAQPFTQLYRNDGDTIFLIEDPTTGSTLQVPGTQYSDAINPTLPTLEDVWRSATAWGDYDNDNDLDLIVTGRTPGGSASLRLYENVGGTDLLSSRQAWPGVETGDVAWADADNDGDLDFIVCGTDDGGDAITLLYENQVNTGADFVPRDARLPGITSCSIEWGDYDNDSDLDLLVVGLLQPQQAVSRIYRNDGAGRFSEAGADLASLLFASSAWGDYDADGDLDVLLNGARMTPFLFEGTMRVYRNDGGVFTDVSDNFEGAFENDETQGRYQGAAAWGDYDNDGLLDFFVTGAREPLGTESLEVYHTDGNDRFTKALAVELAFGNFDGGLFGDAFWGDYDNDLDLDLFVFGEVPSEGATIKTLRNYLPTIPPNAPPTAPTGLQASVQGTTVTLAWNPANDNQTPAPGLSYNLRLGSTPGGLDVHSPMALPETGYRLLARRGNAGHNTQWQLRGLAPGTYYWSVQAIDSSFKGSVFAQEATFTIDG